MKIRIKQICVVVCLLVFIYISGCSNTDNDLGAGDISPTMTFDKNIEAAKSDIDVDSVLSYMALIDNKVIYKSISGDSVNYIKSLTTGENVYLGSTPDFYLSMKQAAFDYPYLYFFVGTLNGQSETDKAENILIKLNVNTGGLEQFENADGSLPGLSAYYFDKHIITLKNIVTEGTTSTFIESFDIEKNDWKRYFECSIDNKSGKGTAVYGVCANQNNIFALYDICNNKKEIDTYLIILDKQYKVEKSIRVNKEMHDYVMTSFIADMQVFDDYIYIYNASNYGYLARIEDDKLEEMYKGRNFEISTNPFSSQPIFYTRRSNRVYLIDEYGKWETLELQISNNYTIKNILADNESCFIVCYADDLDDCAYFVDRKVIDKVQLPCE